MNPVFIVLVAAGLVLLVLVWARRGRADRRGDLLEPPRNLAASTRPAPLQPPADASTGGWPEGAAPIGDLADQVADEARRLVRQNRKIEAIKLVRTATRWDLRKAKAWVERL